MEFNFSPTTMYRNLDMMRVGVQPYLIQSSEAGVTLSVFYWGIQAQDPSQWKKIASDVIFIPKAQLGAWRSCAIRNFDDTKWVIRDEER